MAADRVPLHGIDIANNNRIVTYGTESSATFRLAGTNSVTACRGYLPAVLGFGRIQNTVSDERLAMVFVGKPAQYLTPRTLAHLSPSCSGDGFTVGARAVRDRRKILRPGDTHDGDRAGRQHEPAGAERGRPSARTGALRRIRHLRRLRGCLPPDDRHRTYRPGVARR